MIKVRNLYLEWDIFDNPAFGAMEMDMRFGYGIVTFMRTCGFDALDYAVFYENIEIPVHRTEADTGES